MLRKTRNYKNNSIVRLLIKFLVEISNNNMFYYAKGVEINNTITEIKNVLKLVKFIVYFNIFSIIKHIFTSKFILKNSFLLQIQKNKIFSCIYS